MDRTMPPGPPPGGPPQGGAGPGGMSFLEYMNMRNPQLVQQIGQVANQGPNPAMGRGAPMPPMAGAPMGGPSSMMGGGGMPPQAQAMAMQDPMYLAGQAAARMMASRPPGMPPGGPGMGGPPPAGPPMGGPPGFPPRR